MYQTPTASPGSPEYGAFHRTHATADHPSYNVYQAEKELEM